MQLFYDDRDDAVHEARGSQILYWLDDLDAQPLSVAKSTDHGFLFAGARSIEDYQRLVEKVPHLRDRPDEREPLLRLDTILDRIESLRIPTPRTWRLPLDTPIPADITYPLFVRTAHSSLKIGGRVSRVTNRDELVSEAAELRRILGWDSLILARQWHDFAEAGVGMYGPIPQEIRVWIVDQVPCAWSFHYLNVVSSPIGFPPSPEDLRTLSGMARRIGEVFSSRCVVADFARELDGDWTFIEAGPGSCAGTAHEGVFKVVAARLRGETRPLKVDQVGGLFEFA